MIHTCVCGYSDENNHTHTCDNQCIAYLAARVKKLEENYCSMSIKVSTAIEEIAVVLRMLNERIGIMEDIRDY